MRRDATRRQHRTTLERPKRSKEMRQYSITDSTHSVHIVFVTGMLGETFLRRLLTSTSTVSPLSSRKREEWSMTNMVLWFSWETSICGGEGDLASAGRRENCGEKVKIGSVAFCVSELLFVSEPCVCSLACELARLCSELESVFRELDVKKHKNTRVI